MNIYKPTPGKGLAWGIGLLLFVGAVVILPVMISLFTGKPNPVFLGTMSVVGLMVFGLIGYFVWAAGSLEYRLGKDGLVIRWACNRKVIPLESIKGVRRSVGTSSMKVVGASWPGFHLGSFTDPTGKGTVNMYGSRLWGDILLLRTKWEIIGITPEHPDKFLDELNQLIPGIEADGFGDSCGELQSFSPWKEKGFIALITASVLILAGTGVFLAKTVPGLPPEIPMHFNLAGEVDRYGHPSEIYTPFGIGVLTVVLMAAIAGVVARNNKTSVYLMGFVSLFLALLFSIISVSMVLTNL